MSAFVTQDATGWIIDERVHRELLLSVTAESDSRADPPPRRLSFSQGMCHAEPHPELTASEIETVGTWREVVRLHYPQTSPKHGLAYLQVNQYRDGMSSALRVALWDFEFTLIKRTILRLKGVRGLAFLLSISNSSGTYMRCFDLESLLGVSMEYARSVAVPAGSLRNLVIDRVLTERDVTTLISSSNEVTKPSTTDKRTLRDKFASLSALALPHTLALAVEFGDRDELVLCSGIEVATFRDIISRARAVSAVSESDCLLFSILISCSASQN